MDNWMAGPFKSTLLFAMATAKSTGLGTPYRPPTIDVAYQLERRRLDQEVHTCDGRKAADLNRSAGCVELME